MRLSFLLFIVLCWIPTVFGQIKPTTSDAPLRAVHFVDKNEGWVIGDEGIILHTNDSGVTWDKQASEATATRSSLRAMAFADPYKGMIVGLEVLPFGRGATGVALFTTDGGVHWNRLEVPGLPGLYDVVYTKKDEWIVFGESLPGQNCAALVSMDDGKTWSVLSSPLSADAFITGSASGEGRVVACTTTGSAGVLRGEEFTEQPWEVKSRNVMKLRMRDRDGWAVGKNGFIARCLGTAGASWTSPEGNLPELCKAMDLQGISFRGNHVWAVGKPGNKIVHSGDQGKTWDLQSSGQLMPLLDVCFIDEQHGWAVGEMGTILRTEDSGKSWKVLHRAGHRLACLMVVDKAEDIPASTLTLLAGDQGFFTSVIELSSDTRERDPSLLLANRRINMGIRKMGGTNGETWNQSETCLSIVERLAIVLRYYRPSVLIVGEHSHYSRHVVTQAMTLAANKEKDVSGFGFEPWQCEYIWKVENRLGLTHNRLELNHVQPAIRNTPQRLCWEGWSIVADTFVKPSARECFTLLAYKNHVVRPMEQLALSFNPGKTNLFGQLTLGYGGQARRELPEWNEELAKRWDELKGLESLRNAHWEEAEAKMRLEDEKKNYFRILDKVYTLLSQQSAASDILDRATRFARSGNWQMARECYLMFVDRFPMDPRAAEVTRLLLMQNGSGEIARRFKLKPLPPGAEYRYSVSKDKQANNLAQMVANFQNRKNVFQKRWYDLHEYHLGAMAAGELLNLFDPIYSLDPAVQMTLAANQRTLGKKEEAALAYTRLATAWGKGPWQDAAQMELWLLNRQGTPPKPMVTAHYVSDLHKKSAEEIARIMLKQDATSLRIGNELAASTTTRFAFDDLSLHVLIHNKDLKSSKPIVRLMLDVDRDYSTYYQFDADGDNQRQACVADFSWKCNWRMKNVESDSGTLWVMTIPLVDITGEQFLDSKAWAMNLSCEFPDDVTSIAGLTLRGAINRFAGEMTQPEQMGILLFKGGPTQQTGARE